MGLSNPDFPSFLLDSGFQLKSIGKKINENLATDLVFYSGWDKHALFVEIKGGGVEDDQANEYSKLLGKDSYEGLAIPKVTDSKFSCEVCYACTSTNLEKIIQHRKHNPLTFNFPLIVHEENQIRQDNSFPDFANSNLQKLFSKPLKVQENQLTYTYYPFSDKEETYAKVWEVLQSAYLTFHVSKRQFSEDELKECCHPSYKYYGEKEKEWLSPFVRDVLMLNNQAPDEYRKFLHIIPYDLEKKTWQVLHCTNKSFDKRLEELCKWISDVLDKRKGGNLERWTKPSDSS
ncbi:MAG: hypothetical protein M1368_11215 [Thaumarchaeota archaeon]|nr:hypothetical protein [Nitrososphaerota archaeon]